MYTLTSSSYTTTAVSSAETVKPIATPVVQLPLAKGSRSLADGCFEFVNYMVVVPQRDQSLQPDALPFNKNINSCDFVSAAFGLIFLRFSSLESQPGERRWMHAAAGI